MRDGCLQAESFKRSLLKEAETKGDSTNKEEAAEKNAPMPECILCRSVHSYFVSAFMT
jgi:hypothetical protein